MIQCCGEHFDNTPEAIAIHEAGGCKWKSVTGALRSDLDVALATIQRVRNEIDHAIVNEHVITDGQGIAPGERAPGVKISYLEAALGDHPTPAEHYLPPHMDPA